MTKQLLVVENLDINFELHEKTVHAVRNVSFKVAEGETLALVGESGSGKSVTSMSIMRLLPEKFARYSKDSRITFDGISILDADEKTLRDLRGNRISVIFQEPMTSLNPFMRIGTQLIEAARVHNKKLGKKEAGQKALALLQRVGIKEAERRMKQYPHEFSGGQLQRIMIAMALINEPDLLIADEPTTALDVAVQAQILDLLARLQQAHNMTMLYITHDLNLVRRFADDVTVMRGGRIVETGAAVEVFARPQHEYTKMLLNAGAARKVVPLADNPATVLQAEQISVAVKETAGWFKKRSKTLLEPVSFDLKAGETLGVIGESGCGKTTLAKAVMHLIDAEGRLKINGEAWTRESRRDIQMVFQDPFGAFSPRMNVFNIVSEALRVHEPDLSRAEMRQRVQDVLRQVGLPEDALERYPHAFSGGQRQRLAIARAIIVRPKILVLDEPTSALDVQWQQQILELLADLQKKHGLSLIIISHDLAVIRALSHRVMVLKDGKIVEEGDCETVFASPSSDYTRHLMSFRAG